VFQQQARLALDPETDVCLARFTFPDGSYVDMIAVGKWPKSNAPQLQKDVDRNGVVSLSLPESVS
jgi:hypothetical protein